MSGLNSWQMVVNQIKIGRYEPEDIQGIMQELDHLIAAGQLSWKDLDTTSEELHRIKTDRRVSRVIFWADTLKQERWGQFAAYFADRIKKEVDSSLISWDELDLNPSLIGNLIILNEIAYLEERILLAKSGKLHPQVAGYLVSEAKERAAKKQTGFISLGLDPEHPERLIEIAQNRYVPPPDLY